MGWIVDLVRMKQLVKDFNHQREEKSIGTAYILGLPPLGIFGAYHYYLGNVKLGLIYTFTFGLFGIGWVVDLFRMPTLVKKAGMEKRSVGTAYIMSMPPFGLFGAYHYYLGNYALGIVYTFTLGIFSIGWIVDLFRMKQLVKAANDSTSDHGTTKVTSYVLCISPLGIFGAHHFYLQRYMNGAFYACTFGMFGFGWIFDMFRLPVLYERFADEDKHKYPDEAYLYWFPFGIFGLHHFYLGNKKWGLLYLCSLGCLLIGWIIDGIRMHWLLKDYNKYIEDTDMNNFRICRPSCRSCSVYKCKRCMAGMCGCCEQFSLSRSDTNNTRREDVEMNGNEVSKNQDEFATIQAMYPNEDHSNYGQTENQVNEQAEGEIATVHDSYHVFPNEKEAAPAYDNGAHPGDLGYDDHQFASNEEAGYNEYPPPYTGDAAEHHDQEVAYSTEQGDEAYEQYYDENHATEHYTDDNTQEYHDEGHSQAFDAGYVANPQYDYHENTTVSDGYHDNQREGEIQQQDNQREDEIRHHEDVNVSVSTERI